MGLFVMHKDQFNQKWLYFIFKAKKDWMRFK